MFEQYHGDQYKDIHDDATRSTLIERLFTWEIFVEMYRDCIDQSKVPKTVAEARKVSFD